MQTGLTSFLDRMISRAGTKAEAGPGMHRSGAHGDEDSRTGFGEGGVGEGRGSNLAAEFARIIRVLRSEAQGEVSPRVEGEGREDTPDGDTQGAGESADSGDGTASTLHAMLRAHWHRHDDDAVDDGQTVDEVDSVDEAEGEDDASVDRSEQKPANEPQEAPLPAAAAGAETPVEMAESVEGARNDDSQETIVQGHDAAPDNAKAEDAVADNVRADDVKRETVEAGTAQATAAQASTAKASAPQADGVKENDGQQVDATATPAEGAEAVDTGDRTRKTDRPQSSGRINDAGAPDDRTAAGENQETPQTRPAVNARGGEAGGRDRPTSGKGEGASAETPEAAPARSTETASARTPASASARTSEAATNEPAAKDTGIRESRTQETGAHGGGPQMRVDLVSGQTHLPPASATPSTVQLLGESVGEALNEMANARLSGEVAENGETVHQTISRRMVVELHPKDLGTVRVTLQLRAGELHIEIVSASDKANDLLNSNRDALAQSIRHAGPVLTDLSVRMSHDAGAGRDFQSGQNPAFNWNGGTGTGSGAGGSADDGARHPAADREQGGQYWRDSEGRQETEKSSRDGIYL